MLDFTDNELERYARHILVPEIGATGQARCREASVLIVGLGGLGSGLAPSLAASGLGRLGLMDDDHVDLSNLQRQVLYDTGMIGEAKATAAARRLSALNPLVTIEQHHRRADAETLAALVPHYDVICDGSDNFATRLAISDACVKHGKTLVTGAVQGFSGQLATFRPQSGGPCYRCLFPQAVDSVALTCAEAGVLGPAAGVMGSLMAVDVLREIMAFGNDKPDQTRVTCWDALSGTFRTFTLVRDPACPAHAAPDVARVPGQVPPRMAMPGKEHDDRQTPLHDAGG